MNRYENGKIYKIVDVGYNKCYIGSTTEPLSKRMERHRKCHKRYLETGKVDTRCRLLFEEFGVENCKIELLENYACMSKEELLRKEGEYIQSMECVNKCVAGRTPQEYKELHKERYSKNQKEWYEKNKEYVIQRNREYQEKHKEEVAQRRKDYYERNKEQINNKNKVYYENNFEKIKQHKAEYALNNKEFLAKKNKEWYEANKEYVKEQMSKYYERKREEICSKKRETVECECGSIIRIHAKKRHERTTKHQTFFEQK